MNRLLRKTSSDVPATTSLHNDEEIEQQPLTSTNTNHDNSNKQHIIPVPSPQPEPQNTNVDTNINTSTVCHPNPGGQVPSLISHQDSHQSLILQAPKGRHPIAQPLPVDQHIQTPLAYTGVTAVPPSSRHRLINPTVVYDGPESLRSIAKYIPQYLVCICLY